MNSTSDTDLDLRNSQMVSAAYSRYLEWSSLVTDNSFALSNRPRGVERRVGEEQEISHVSSLQPTAETLLKHELCK